MLRTLPDHSKYTITMVEKLIVSVQRYVSSVSFGSFANMYDLFHPVHPKCTTIRPCPNSGLLSQSFVRFSSSIHKYDLLHPDHLKYISMTRCIRIIRNVQVSTLVKILTFCPTQSSVHLLDSIRSSDMYEFLAP